MLEVRLDCADKLVAIAIEMHLVDVIQRSMWMVTVAWAQLEEQCIADRWIGELQNLPLNLGLQYRAVGSKTQLLASNYSTFGLLVVYESFVPQIRPFTHFIDATSFN